MGSIEEINENAHECVELPCQLILGTMLLEAAIAAEITHFLHVTIEALRLATARGIVEGHLAFGETQLIHHQKAESLPRLHQMHGVKSLSQLVEIQLPMIGVECHSHVGDLSPTHSRSQKMLPGMEEGIKHHEFF